MPEYDTGLLVELEPGTRIYLSLYEIAKDSSIETIISRLPETTSSGKQLNFAAKRALSAIYLIRIPGLHTRRDDGNQEARRLIGLIDQVVLNEPSQWSSREVGLKSLETFLRLSQHACLMLGSQLPREYVKRLHMQAIIVGFTDDSDEEHQAMEALADAINDKPIPMSGGIDVISSFAIDQICEMVQELIFLAADVRVLIKDILIASSEHFGSSVPSHAMAGMLLLTRISQDIEGVRLLTQAERPVQALTLDAVIFELSYLIGYFGSNSARADRWLKLDGDERMSHDDGSFPSIKDFVGYTLLNVLPNLTGIELRQKVNERYKGYKFLCGYKHGHAGDIRRAAMDVRPDGGVIFTPDPQQDYLETWLTLVGIWRCLYPALTVAVNAFFQFNYQNVHLNERTSILAHRLVRIDKELEELERAAGINNVLKQMDA